VIETMDGRTLRHREEFNRGSDGNPLSAADVERKFLDNAQRRISPARAGRILELSGVISANGGPSTLSGNGNQDGGAGGGGRVVLYATTNIAGDWRGRKDRPMAPHVANLRHAARSRSGVPSAGGCVVAPETAPAEPILARSRL
jgi:hypothetical protein